MEYQLLAGELVYIDKASDEMGIRIHNVKSRLLQIPRVVNHLSRLDTDDALEQKVRDEIYRVLDELSRPHDDKFKDVA